MATVSKVMARWWRDWIRSLLVIILVTTALRSAVADWNDVPSGSMKPSILEGDRIVVNKLAYDLRVPFTTWRVARWSAPERGDIVVLLSPRDSTRLVKRVVGTPGDTLALRANRLVVNGEEVAYSPLSPRLLAGRVTTPPGRLLAAEELDGEPHPVMLTPRRSGLDSFGPVTVPAACYFVMGDNRDESLDSRVFGFVDRDRILGRALGVAASVDPRNHFSPRWDRFLSGLR